MSDRTAVTSSSPSSSPPLSLAWAAAARLVVRWLEQRERVDALLESLPRSLTRAERARVQHLFFGVVRHGARLEAHVAALVPRPPRARLRAVLLLAGFELIEGGTEGHVARVVHHAVEQAKSLASPSEARLVNAVVRKLAASLAAEAAPPRLASADVLAAYFSHPEWLVRRWLEAWGAAPTRSLLELHQRPAALYARWRDPASPAPAWLGSPVAPGFFEVPSGHWNDLEPLLAAGRIYLQDPATALAVDLLAPRPGETLLDACAAPGGKCVLTADRMGRGRLVCLDVPSPRLDRLKENLAKISGVDAALVPGDLLKGVGGALQEAGLPVEFAGVLLDVPCSNTGVMRHRVDVKWRLQEGDFAQHARQQLALLRAAARLVAPGGRLVYSTCSLDAQENERVVAEFLRDPPTSFTLENQVFARPWETGRDGAAAFLLRRVG